MARPPTPEQWVEMRPIVTKWYLREQRTARWIASEIKRTRDLSVTTKMLRDRFRAWNLTSKYKRYKNRSAQQLQENDPQVSHANAFVVDKPDNTNAIRSKALPGGLLSITPNRNLSGEQLTAIPDGSVVGELPTPHAVQGTAAYSDPPFPPTHGATMSGALYTVRSSASLPSTLPHRKLDTISSGSCYNTVPGNSFDGVRLPSDFNPAPNRSPHANEGDLSWWSDEEALLYYSSISSNFEPVLDPGEVERLKNTVELVDVHRSRPPDTPDGDIPLIKTLKAIQNFFRSHTDKIQRMYLQPRELDQEPALELQRVAANAHQAVASQRFFSRKTFQELSKLESRAKNVLPQLNINSMHPRILTVLLRLIVDSTSNAKDTGKQSEDLDMLSVVKQLFQKVSTMNLFHWHPVALLCSMPEGKDQTDQLLHCQMELAKVELYDQIRPYDPVFVAWEEVYSARVLASLGRTKRAEDLLNTVFYNLSIVTSDEELYAHADTCRTWGYAKLNAGQPHYAIGPLKLALEEFRRSGYGNTENVLYTHLACSWAYRRMKCLYACEQSLWEALNLWKLNDSLYRNQSAVNFIRDLDEVLAEQEKFCERDKLRNEYPTYFEDLKG